MKDFATIEKLQKKVSATYGSVLKFGDHVLVTDACYQNKRMNENKETFE